MIIGMGRVAKVTISLPEEVLAYVDDKQRASGLSRSEVVRRVIERARREERERELDDQFTRGWREQPETEGEFGWVESATLDALADLPWGAEAPETAHGKVPVEGHAGEARRDLVGKPAASVGAPSRPARRPR
jgi:Arc/MetJ-type ribon-helix-helix transcriptional regulator